MATTQATTGSASGADAAFFSRLACIRCAAVGILVGSLLAPCGAPDLTMPTAARLLTLSELDVSMRASRALAAFERFLDGAPVRQVLA
jgi:hypothetical protein